MTDSRVGLGSNTSTTQPLPTADVQGTPQGKGAPADGEAELVVVPDAINELLARAGVDRTGGIHDRVDARGTEGARSSAEALGAKEALPPAAPRAVVMGDREIQGAEAFATNIDRVFNSFLPSAVTDDGKPVMREGNNLVDLAAYFLGANANANGAEKRVVSAADSRGANGAGYQGDGKFFGPNGPIIRDKMTPQQLFSKEHVQGLFAAATQRSQALGATGAGGMTDAQMKQVAELTADQLLAAFLKCNINDPNNNPENQNMLHQVSTDMRQLQIDASQKKAAEAEKQIQEAQKYAEQAQVIGTIVMVIVIIIMLIITIFTFGAGAAAGAAAVGGVAAGTTAAATAATTAATAAATAAASAGAAGAASAAGAAAAASAAAAAAGASTAGVAAAGVAASAAFSAAAATGASTAACAAAASAAGAAAAAGASAAAAAAAGAAAASAVVAGAAPAAVAGAAAGACAAAGGSAAAAGAAGGAAGVAAGGTVAASAAAGAAGATAGAACAGLGAGVGAAAGSAAATSSTGIGAFLSGFFAGAQAATSAAAPAIIAGILVSLGLQSIKIGAETKAANKQLDAESTQNEVKKHQAIAEMFQAQIDDQAAIIKIIMESKNQVVEAVLKMMKASQSSYQAVSAAGQSKG